MLGPVVAGEAPPPLNAPPGMLLWEAATAPEIPYTPDLLARGQKLYGIRCAICHGLDGQGKGPSSLYMRTPPRDFSRGMFKFRTSGDGEFPSDEDLFRTVTAGFPAYGMPSYRYLSEEDRWALAQYVKHLASMGLEESFKAYAREEGERFDPVSTRRIIALKTEPGPALVIPPEPADPDGQAIDRGKLLFEGKQYLCSTCHGVTGQGDGPSVVEGMKDSWGNPIRPRNLTLARAYRKSGWRPEDTVRRILLGVPGTPMPAAPNAVKTPEGVREVWDIARYVEHLSTEAQNEALNHP